MKQSERPLAVITGATSGIGAAFARSCAVRGYDLLLTGRRETVLRELARELGESFGVTAECRIADFGDPDAIEALASEIGGLPRVDLLVNNAGYGGERSFIEDEYEEQEKMLWVHVHAPARLVRAAVDVMPAGSAIINVSSLASFIASPASEFYCATKAFLTSFSRSLSISCRPRGIRVQALCPGFTRTDFHDKLGIPRESLKNKGIVRWMPAWKVAELSMRALDRDRTVYIPGFLNRLLVLIAGLIPFRVYRHFALRQKKLFLSDGPRAGGGDSAGHG